MWIEREISTELETLSRTFPVIALVGPRQVGKTSILERTFGEFTYVSMDVGSHAEAAETRPREFLKRYPPPLLLDEIQYTPSFFRHIKTVVDSRKDENGLFVITGSQNFLLMENLSETLAGRAAVIPFLGLSGKEWGPVKDTDPALRWRDFLWKGAFPGLWKDPSAPPSRERWYQGYVTTYLERDVRNLLNVGSLRDFERFIRACAARCGRMLNLSELGRDVGISTPTAKQWLSVLQASNQILLLEPYHRSLGKRLIKSPKLYFTDTGLAAYLMGFSNADALWSSREAGFLWENYVVSQWQRYRDWHEPSTGLWYWRDQGGNEVDILLEKDARITAVECKMTEIPGKRETGGIRKLRQFYGEEAIKAAFIAAPVDIPFQVEADVTVVPGWTAWSVGDKGAASITSSEVSRSQRNRV